MNRILFYCIIMLIMAFLGNYNLSAQQNVGIGTTTPDESALLELQSTTSGLLPPRMNKSQRDAIATPAEGLLIFCTDCNVEGLHQYINAQWQAITPNDCNNVGNYGIVVNPATGKVWLDRNLGASQVAISSSDALSYGHLYQWGRGADGHQLRTSSTTSTQASHWLAGNNAWNSTFITSGFLNWLSTSETHMWSGIAAENNPCPSGFRVPTNAEWNQERMTWSSNDADGAFNSALKLPVAGYRDYITGTLENVGMNGSYWSSTVSGAFSRNLGFGSASANMFADRPAEGFSVRCIKD